MIATDPPAGYTLLRLADQPSSVHAAARKFCLDTIKEFYGFDYRREWHVDLDSLLLAGAENHYSAQSRGAFWLLYDAAGAIAGSGGIRHLGWKPNLIEMFAGRYPHPEEVASLWRVYVRRDLRGQGLGSWLARLAEEEAARMGYDTMYLHATSDALATLAFWRSVGYRVIEAPPSDSTHFDKLLPQPAVG